MNNTNLNSNTQSNSTFVGRFPTVVKAVFGLSFLLGAGILAPSQALAWHCTLSVSPTTIQSGSSATLSWTSADLTALSIDNGIGAVTPIDSGSTSISPTANTTYTGSGSSADGPVTCTTSIKVTTPPPPAAPTCTLSADSTSIQSGDSATLSWTTANATSFSIDNGLGSETPVAAGSASVSPTATTTYTGTATGPGGTITCTVYIAVCAVPPPPPPPPPPPTLACTLSASPTSINSGDSSTLSWTTTDATSFSIDNGVGSTTPVAAGSTSVSPSADTTYTGTATDTYGKTVTCQATITIPPPTTTGGGCSGNCGGGGGGGGGPSTPSVVLGVLPHVGNQPLAQLYLSQIPYTGLDLGTFGTILYWAALIAWALALAYLVLFGAAPFVNRSLRSFGSRVKEALNAPEPVYAGTAGAYVVPAVATKSVAAPKAPEIVAPAKPGPYERPRGYSSYEGFKSFAHNGSLSIDDIVKGLARSHSVPAAPAAVAAEPNVEPVYENVEPIYENIEPIMNEDTQETAPATPAPAHIRGLVAALVEGDRAAVFAGLRQQIRGGGSPEKLVSDIAVLLDDAYRARVDGTSSDADTARLVARLDTPTLEKLVASLTTAIDSSYTTNVTGAKIALTRALAVLGA